SQRAISRDLMRSDYLAILTFLFTIIFLMIQRAESKKRLIVFLSMLIPLFAIGIYMVYRDAIAEGVVAFGLSLLLNFLFWVLIGRYNPVGSSDEIQVLGLDD